MCKNMFQSSGKFPGLFPAKKGPRTNIENYRPIANLCSTSKIFEKALLARIMQIEKDNNVDLTGVTQHGFKKKKSSVTAALHLLTKIAKA